MVLLNEHCMDALPPQSGWQLSNPGYDLLAARQFARWEKFPCSRFFPRLTLSPTLSQFPPSLIRPSLRPSGVVGLGCSSALLHTCGEMGWKACTDILGSLEAYAKAGQVNHTILKLAKWFDQCLQVKINDHMSPSYQNEFTMSWWSNRQPSIENDQY